MDRTALPLGRPGYLEGDQKEKQKCSVTLLVMISHALETGKNVTLDSVEVRKNAPTPKLIKNDTSLIS